VGTYNRDGTECCCRFSKKKAKTVHQSNPFKAQPMEEWQIAKLEEG